MTSVAVELDALGRIGVALVAATRRRILRSMMDGPVYPAELAAELGLGKANMSNHLSCLRGCGLVVAEPEGRRVRYEIADPLLADALRSLERVVLVVDTKCEHDR